jgi:predicted acyltransferase
LCPANEENPAPALRPDFGGADGRIVPAGQLTRDTGSGSREFEHLWEFRDTLMESEIVNVPSGRVVSIDALRGFDMFWIIGGDAFFRALFKLIDTPWSRTLFDQLEHTKWNGFTFYDLIFPLFLFIVGAAMPFAISKRLQRGDSRKELYIHIVKRTLTLFALGLVYNHILDLDFAHFRWAGVLQRIALCYFFAAMIFMWLKIRGQAISIGFILVTYWIIMMVVPVPGFGAGVWTPEGNLSAYIDRLLLPGRFCCYTFGDNEGILTTLPAIATTLLGGLAGHLLRSALEQRKKVLGLVAAGGSSLVLALIWGALFPINKLLWSSSYVLFAAGWSFLLLALFYWLVDVRGYQKWAFPFIIIGLNPITIYVLQSVFDFGTIASIFVHGFIDDLGAFKPVFWVTCILAVKWLFLYFLYRQKIFLKA